MRGVVLLCALAMLVALPARSMPDDTGVELVVGDAARERIDAAFGRFDPAHEVRRAARRARLDALGKALFEREVAGENLACSRQMFVEAKWLVGYTAWWHRVDLMLDALEESLDEPDQAFADEPSPEDGLYGVCATEDFVRVEATLEAYFELADAGEHPSVPRQPKAWARSPEALVDFLTDLLVSDIPTTGEDMRSRMGGLVSIMAATQRRREVLELLRTTTTGEPLTRDEQRAVRNALLDFVDAWQDPETGYWGAWYRDDDERVFKTTDLSITYHIVHGLKGQVRRWPELIRTTLALREQTYPFGWRSRGRWTNHNNYDLARIFRYGWPHMTAEQQAEVRETIQAMVDWAFAHGLEEDYAGFALAPELSSSVGAELYFGVSFLDAAGYFSEFPWTGQLERPAEPRRVCEALSAHAAELAVDVYVSGAKKKLRRACGEHLVTRPSRGSGARGSARGAG